MRRLEEGDTQRPAVALEAVPQRRQRPLGVQPLAEIRQNLLARLQTVQRLQPRPLPRLRLADEVKRRVREDRTLAVEAVSRQAHVAVGEQMRLDDGLERRLTGLLHDSDPVSDVSQTIQKRVRMWTLGLDLGGIDPLQQFE